MAQVLPCCTELGPCELSPQRMPRRIFDPASRAETSSTVAQSQFCDQFFGKLVDAFQFRYSRRLSFPTIEARIARWNARCRSRRLDSGRAHFLSFARSLGR